jgi:hypothetical protein
MEINSSSINLAKKAKSVDNDLISKRDSSAQAALDNRVTLLKKTASKARASTIISNEAMNEFFNASFVHKRNVIPSGKLADTSNLPVSVNSKVNDIYTSLAQMPENTAASIRPRLNSIIKKVIAGDYPEQQVKVPALRFIDNSLKINAYDGYSEHKKIIDQIDLAFADQDSNKVANNIHSLNESLQRSFLKQTAAESLETDQLRHERELAKIPNFISDEQYLDVYNLVKNLDFNADTNTSENIKNINKAYRSFVNNAKGTSYHSSNFNRALKGELSKNYHIENSLNGFLAQKLNLSFTPRFFAGATEAIITRADSKTAPYDSKPLKSVANVLGVLPVDLDNRFVAHKVSSLAIDKGNDRNFGGTFRFNTNSGKLFENTAIVDYAKLKSTYANQDLGFIKKQTDSSIASELTSLNLNRIFKDSRMLGQDFDFFRDFPSKGIINDNADFSKLSAKAAALQTSPLHQTLNQIYNLSSNAHEESLFVKASQSFFKKNKVDLKDFNKFTDEVSQNPVNDLNQVAKLFNKHTKENFLNFSLHVTKAYNLLANKAVEHLKTNHADKLNFKVED